MSDWDDDDFEPEVGNLAPKVDEEDITPKPIVVQAPQPSNKPKPKYMQKEHQMEDLGRELTPKEREDIQRRNDFLFAKEMFGGNGEDDESASAWAEIMTKEEFESWGDKAGKFFASRHLAGHYGDFLSKILAGLAAPLAASEVRKMSNLLQKIAEEKKGVEEKDKKSAPKGGAKGGKTAKPSLKATGAKAGGNKGGAVDDYGDDYDDFM